MLRRGDVRAPEAIDRAVACRGGEPGRGVRRDPVPRPPLERAGERVLRALLGQIPVAGGSDQRGDDASPVVPERTVERLESAYISQMGRTSIEPCLAPGIFD